MSQKLTSILSPQVHHVSSSLNSTIKKLKHDSANPLDEKSRLKTAKVLTRAAEGKTVSRGVARQTAQRLADAGYLKSRYASDVGLAARVIHTAAAEAAGAEIEPHTEAERKEHAKEDLEEKKKMWARARGERMEAAEKKAGAKRSIGLEEWQKSKTSIGQAVKDKERERREAVDVMID